MLDVIYINNVKHVKSGKQRINVCSMAPNKMMGLVHVRR